MSDFAPGDVVVCILVEDEVAGLLTVGRTYRVSEVSAIDACHVCGSEVGIEVAEISPPNPDSAFCSGCFRKLDNEFDALIAERWPREWARANDSARPGRSKARNKLRKQYRDAVEREAWRAQNPDASCGTCDHCGHFPQIPATRTCDLDSDFDGYALTKLDDWCIRWELKTEPSHA